MANSKKTTIVEDVIEDEVVETVKKTTASKKVNKPKRDPNEYIACRSMIFGELILIGPKSRTKYIWSNEGDFQEVEFQDLMSWKALRSKYLFEPFIIIEDEELCEEWNKELGPVYSSLQNVNLRDILNMPHRQFVAQLKKLSPSMKSSIQNMAYSMIQDRTLYDLRKIEAMDEILGTELKMMI